MGQARMDAIANTNTLHLASYPGRSQFLMFQRITLKNWEKPGDEATLHPRFLSPSVSLSLYIYRPGKAKLLSPLSCQVF